MSQFYDDVPLQLPNGDTHYPRTKTNSVWSSGGERLDNVLKGLLDYAAPLPVNSKNQFHDITSYPMGVSMTRSTNTSGGWTPTHICNIITFRTQEDRGTQLLIGESNPISVRSRTSSGWSAWETYSKDATTLDGKHASDFAYSINIPQNLRVQYPAHLDDAVKAVYADYAVANRTNAVHFKYDSSFLAIVQKEGSYGSVLLMGYAVATINPIYYRNNNGTWYRETLSLGSHTHDDRYYTEAEINTKLNAKADNSHTHDDRYYTEAEINTKLNAKADNSKSITANLTAAGWSGTSAPYTQVVTVSGVTASNNIMFDLGMGVTLQQYEQGTDAMLKATAQSTNTVTIKAFGDKPTVNIPIQFVILG